MTRSARGNGTRLAVGHELEADEEAAPPDLADVGVAAQPVAEERLQPVALGRARGDQVFVLEDAQDLGRHRRAHRVVGIGEAVDEARPAEHDVPDRTRRRHQPEREVAGGAALRPDEDVRANSQWSTPNQRPVRPKPVMTADGEALGARRITNVDWQQFADEWRGAYAPSMNRVRTGELPWTNLDALHRMGLDALIEKFAITGLDEADKEWFNLTWHA